MMETRTDETPLLGIRDGVRWILGGAISGVVASAIFGVFLWSVDPTILEEAVPAIYGLDPSITVGWVFHLVHGLVLGVAFGLIVTRKTLFSMMLHQGDTGFIAAMGSRLRFTLAGLVFGLAVWAILPVIVLPIWVSLGIGDPDFPAFAFESLMGHAIYGFLLGLLFTIFVDTSRKIRRSDPPFDNIEEPSRSDER